ncbi:hypothetical protein [Paraburkholderia sp. C35]|uniref:hypothetical protein n=1 Tax=Paraburkholderia sp. C35 TaxID=2126993 RepID=UPI001EF5617C|nr:hypothetical protein [Paraburkholderia sp. C35]
MTMTMTRKAFEEKIGEVLRDHGADVTADLSDELVAYWNGHALAYVLIHETAPGPRYEHFVMDAERWKHWRTWFEAWLNTPTFSVRPEVSDWIADDPPVDAGN